MEAGVHIDLLRYVDVLQMAADEYWLGTALQELTSPHASALLDQWQQSDASAATLARLSRAARQHPAIFESYRPLTRGKSGQSQLTGKIETNYLFAMVTEHLGPADAELRRWLVTLRAWALVIGLRLEQHGNVRDGHLRQIAKGIRLACDRQPEWTSLLSSLTGPTDRSDGLTSFLSYRAYQLRQDSRDMGGEQVKFLRAVINLAEGRSNPEDAPNPIASIARQLPLPTTIWAISTLDQPEGTDEEARDLLLPTWLAEETDSGPISLAHVRPTDSYIQQRSSARSVYLLDAEALHHLPWSWRSLNPFERRELSQWISHLLSADAPEETTLGILIWLAVGTCRSLHQITQIPVSAAPLADWAITPNLQELVRLPPRRGNGWEPGSVAIADWVEGVAPAIRIRLPLAVRAPMERLRSSLDQSDSLAHWWPYPTPPASLFLQKRPPTLQRVTPGMLGQLLPQRLYEETGDGSFARLLASHPQTGLPGACAYANWPASMVEQKLNAETPTPVPDDLIGAGSRLSPLEAPLHDAIRQAGQTLKQRMADGDWVWFHNSYVAYLALSLFAATGARPIRDPFESRAHFDLEAAFVYIDDKSSGSTRNGRLVPLPPLVIRQLRAYEHHLLQVSKQLDAHHSSLAAAIRDARKGAPGASLPYLFMLSNDGPLTWESVSATAIENTGLFSCLLPLNLFRHRLAQKLRLRGLNPEIIDGLLGHAEFGCATYGDDSTRTWQADMAVARPHLIAAHQDLGFSPLPPTQIHASIKPISARSDPPTRLYGSRARALAREQVREAAHAQATQIIQRFAKGRELTTLSEDELWELSKLLFLSDTGMPLATGYIRYAVLLDALEKAWENQGQRVRIGRRLMRLNPPAALFSEEAPGTSVWHKQLHDRIATLHQNGIDHWSLDQQRLLAATALCVDGRVTNAAVLQDVLCGRYYRVTVLDGQYDLEHQDSLTPDDPDAVVERYPIPAWLAMLLAPLALIDISTRTIKKAKTPLDNTSFGPLDSLRQSGPSDDPTSKVTWAAHLSHLAARVDQQNAITLPGILAAWYAGRATSASLGWRDRIRLLRGRPPVFDEDESNERQPGEDDALPSEDFGKAAIAIRSADNALNVEALQRDCRTFFASVRDLLPDNFGKKGDSLSPVRRRTVAADIRRLIKGANGKVSPATLQLTQWIAALVGGEITGQRDLKRSTIARYFSALSPSFEGFAYDSDLMAMDGDELTELYAAMLGALTQQDTQYTAGRLAVFHRWLARRGADVPDWSEMPATVTTAHRAPGVITEAEYQTAQHLIMGRDDMPESFRLTSAFLLLGCYRFGLRGGECLGLRRDDWIEAENHPTLVLIQNHPWRKLKSKASRRQVPLLFQLTDQERAIIRRIQTQYEALHGHDRSFPLLGDDAHAKSLSKTRAIQRHVITVLKQVTGNPLITLHHARHTAANRIACVLLDIHQEYWKDISRADVMDHDDPRLESILMGVTGISRRQSWGLARYLGHAGTHTVWRSYLHLQPDWARQLLDIPRDHSAAHVPEIVDLSAAALGAGIHGDLLAARRDESTPLDVRGAFAFMRLIALGKSPTAATVSLGIDESAAEELTCAIETIGRRLRLSPKGASSDAHKNDPFEFLRRYPTQTWNRMMTWARTVDPASLSMALVDTQLPPLALLVEMTGATGQLVMWTPGHFATARRLLSLAQIGDDEFLVVRTKHWHSSLEMRATASGFAVKDPATYAKRIQIDSAGTDDPALGVARRAAILFQERPAGVARNRLELLLLLIGLSAGIRTCHLLQKTEG